MIRALLKQARPKQWVKNVLVFAAPGRRRARQLVVLSKALAVFVAFCMVEQRHLLLERHPRRRGDRQHPTKRNRPIASGSRCRWASRRWSGRCCCSVASRFAFVMDWHTGFVAVGYVVLTTLYSTVLKHVAVVDLVAVPPGSCCAPSPARW
jgi:decaprenyl-phosphate phosphoribosyltransferase